MDALYITNAIAIVVFGYGAFLYGRKRCGGIAAGLCLAFVSPIVLMMGFLGVNLIAAMSVGILLSQILSERPSDTIMLLISQGLLIALSVSFATYAFRLKPENENGA